MRSWKADWGEGVCAYLTLFLVLGFALEDLGDAGEEAATKTDGAVVLLAKGRSGEAYKCQC